MEYLHQFAHLFSSEGLVQMIEWGGLLAVCLIIFAETGIFPLLPGDSLLVVCGLLAATPNADGHTVLNLAALLVVVPLCAIVGDQVGYQGGKWLGVKMYKWKAVSLGPIPLFKPEYLKQTESFYKRWGVFTIVACRWVPIVRTFAPIVAGITRMPFSTFISYNVIGAFSWVWSMVLLGFAFGRGLKTFFPNFDLVRHIDKLVIVVVLLSILPIIYTVWKEKQTGKKPSAKKAPKKVAKKKKR